MGASGNEKKSLKKIKTINTEVQKGLYNNKICEIKKDKISGLGFFCKILSPDSKKIIPVLVTSYQLIGDSEIINEKIEFILNGKTYSLNIDDSRKVYTNDDVYNTTIIEIKKEDKLDIDSFFDIEIDYNEKNLSDYLVRQSIVLLDKNKGNKLDIFKIRSMGMNKNEYEMKYLYGLCKEAYGSPLLNIDTNKIIAIHKNYLD